MTLTTVESFLCGWCSVLSGDTSYWTV